jgi:hypothetical protein
MKPRLRLALPLVGALVLGLGVTAGASPLCAEQPEPSRWTADAEPDAPVDRMELVVHRGAAELAPENTLWAFRYAIAYDVEYIEVDVQQTLDHRYVAFHDPTLDDKTDGAGPVALKTFAELRALNAADNPKWKGSAYDPAPLPSLEEVLELAAETGVGVAFDLKESVTDTASVARMAQQYGLIEESFFQPYVPGRAEQIKAVAPEARLLLSNQGLDELPDGAPRGTFYAASREYDLFGSALPGFDAGRINEAHDGCAQVIPNVYQGEVTGRGGDLLHARALGADGAQSTAGGRRRGARPPVATVLAARGRWPARRRAPAGLPDKALTLGDGSRRHRRRRLRALDVPAGGALRRRRSALATRPSLRRSDAVDRRASCQLAAGRRRASALGLPAAWPAPAARAGRGVDRGRLPLPQHLQPRRVERARRRQHRAGGLLHVRPHARRADRAGRAAGLDFLAITDHNRVESLYAPDYASSRLTLLPGTSTRFPTPTTAASSCRRWTCCRGHPGRCRHRGVPRRGARARRDGGGQPPVLRQPRAGDALAWDKSVAESLQFDAVEVWNSLWLTRHDTVPAYEPDNHAAVKWWDANFAAARRGTALGGSDNHWKLRDGNAGVGQPTTWVYAADRTLPRSSPRCRPAGRPSPGSRPRSAARACCSTSSRSGAGERRCSAARCTATASCSQW